MTIKRPLLLQKKWKIGIRENMEKLKLHVLMELHDDIATMENSMKVTPKILKTNHYMLL